MQGFGARVVTKPFQALCSGLVMLFSVVNQGLVAADNTLRARVMYHPTCFTASGEGWHTVHDNLVQLTD